MQCSCGAETVLRTVVKDAKVVSEYIYCRGCGRCLTVKDSAPDIVTQHALNWDG